MKILLANFVYNWGSTGYICRDIKRTLEAKGHEVVVAAAFDWGEPKSGVFTFCTLLERVIAVHMNKLGYSKFAGSPRATRSLINFIKHETPDIVHVHVLNNQCCNMYDIFEWLGENNIKTVITHHAEILYTGCCNYAYDCNQWIDNQCKNCPNPQDATGSYYNSDPHKMWLRMEKAFSYFKPENILMTTVSPWVEKRVMQSKYLKDFACTTIMNGVDTTVFNRKDNLSKITQSKIPSSFKDFCLYVSASFKPSDRLDIKGGYYLVEIAKKMPKQKFLVVATACDNVASLPSNVIVWGQAKSQEELAMLYSQASLTVLTSRKETFSMICAESLCCGTPVVGFKAGGPESISIPKYSKFVDQGDIDLLSSTIYEFIGKAFNRDVIAQTAKSLYSKEMMVYNYLGAYTKLVRRW